MHLNRIKQHFNKAAKHYDDYAILQYETTKELFSLAKPYLKGLTLDLGCGTGYFQEISQIKDIIQLDLAFNMCQIAVQKNNNYAITANINNLPIKENSLESIFSSLTLQWSENLNLTLKEINHTLKKDHHLAFSIIGDGSLNELKESLAKTPPYPKTHSFITKENLKKALKQEGFLPTTIKNTTSTLR